MTLGSKDESQLDFLRATKRTAALLSKRRIVQVCNRTIDNYIYIYIFFTERNEKAVPRRRDDVDSATRVDTSPS